MAITKQDANKVSARVYSRLSLILAVVLLIIGLAGFKTGTTINDTVNKELIKEKIYFPPKGHPSFNEQAFPEAQKYAGKQVVDGTTAKAYADTFLAKQLELVSGGKTSSEMNAAAAADPTNQALQQTVGAMFQISTGKALLLSSYGASAQAMAIRNMGIAALAGSAALALLAAVEAARSKMSQN
jgi:hypothetical protein